MANTSLVQKRYVYIQLDLIAEDFDTAPDAAIEQIPEWLVFVHSNGRLAGFLCIINNA